MTLRVVVGWCAAGGFVALAWWLVARTDWRGPSEAEAPELEG